MEWLEETRRNGFVDHLKRIPSAGTASAPDESKIAGKLDGILPAPIRDRALSIGNELILPYVDALAAIAIANEYQIAVLGLDSGEVREDGFQFLDSTMYDRGIEFTGDWSPHVAAMNAEAERWIKGHRIGKNCGYILTSTSKEEFAQLKH
jgi:hypothetical protein